MSGMTKRHFLAFAQELQESEQSEDIRLYCVRLIADVAQRFNERFDRERFMRACRQEHDTTDRWR